MLPMSISANKMKMPASLIRIFLAFVLSGLFSSCIFENRSCCFLSIGFTYTYNVKDADAFPSEVKELELYIFDSDGVFVERFRENGGAGFSPHYRMILPNLEAGKYTFVALGRNRPIREEEGEFVFPALQAGISVLDDLKVQLHTRDAVSALDFAALYDGVQSSELKSGAQYVDIPMVKLTNRVRVVLMPYSGTGTLQTEDYRFSVRSGAVRFDYKGNMDYSVPTVFRPHHYAGYASPSAHEVEVGEALVSDFHLSRLLLEDKPTLVVSDSGGRELIQVNLAWLLSLQGIAEHRREWSDQEYLDRQDAYSITFFLHGDAFIKSRIIVNGWVISIEDVALG